MVSKDAFSFHKKSYLPLFVPSERMNEEGAVVSPSHSIPFPSRAKIVFSAAGKEPSKVRATLGNARHEDSVNSRNVINVIFCLPLSPSAAVRHR